MCVVERVLQRRIDAFRAGVAIGGNFTVKCHHGGMTASGHRLVAAQRVQLPSQHGEYGEKREAKENVPAPPGTLLANRGQRDSLQCIALPVRAAKSAGGPLGWWR